MTARLVAAGLLGLGACGGEPSGAPAGSPEGAWFVEDAAAAGLDFVHVSGLEQRFHFPEIMGGGVALFDFDADGWLDVYCVQSGDLVEPDRVPAGNRLFRNLGDGTFEDVTERARVGDRGYGMGAACGDYDADGDLDLYVTNVGPDVLYRNEGDGSFRDVTAEAGLGHPGWGTSAAFGDFDGDGDLDLYVVEYLEWSLETEQACGQPSSARDYCSPVVYASPAADVLYENLGDGTFADVSAREGVAAVRGNGLGIAVGDFDGDGRQDPYVANDMSANRLWTGRAGERRDTALVSGCALSGTGFAESGMGVQAVDLEGDGDLDLFLSHLRNHTNTYYRNDGSVFADATSAMGLAWPSRPFTGFGLGFADFDHDGDLDLYVANGHVAREEPVPDASAPYAQENQLFEQTEPLKFVEASPTRDGVWPASLETSRGAAFGDLDNDGDVDVVVVNRDARVQLLRNRRGGEGHWLVLEVLDGEGRLAVGAQVRLVTGGRPQTRRVDPAYSYLSSNDTRVHFGLGPAAVVEALSVRWPDGTEESFEAPVVDRRHTLRRGAGR